MTDALAGEVPETEPVQRRFNDRRRPDIASMIEAERDNRWKGILECLYAIHMTCHLHQLELELLIVKIDQLGNKNAQTKAGS